MLVGLGAAIAWLSRAPTEAPLRTLAQRAAEEDLGVLYVPNVGHLLERTAFVLPEGIALAGGESGMLSAVPSWLGSAPGLLVLGQDGLEVRLDLAPSRAMATKLVGHLRRDTRLRGGALPEDSGAVWWRRGAGRSTSRWAFSRPIQARRLLDLEDAENSEGESGGVSSNADAWLRFRELGAWHVWIEAPGGELNGPAPASPAQARSVRLLGARGRAGYAVGLPEGFGAPIWATVGLDVSDLLGKATWLFWAERDAVGARVTLWRRSAARKEGASVDLEVPRIARWIEKPGGLEDALPAETVVRRLGGEIRREEMADGSAFVGYDDLAIELLRREAPKLRALATELSEGESALYLRPSALADWWAVAREFGRFGRPAEPPWWAREPFGSLIDEVDSINLRLTPDSAVVDAVLVAQDR